MTRKMTAMVVTIVALAAAGPAGAAQQDEQTPSPSASDKPTSIAIGFHDSAAPVGIRIWFPGHKIGLDLGAGFSTEELTLTDERNVPAVYDTTLLGFTLDVGIPIVLKSWSRVQVLGRPGFTYQRQDAVGSDSFGPAFVENVETTNIYTGRAEIEAEVFLADNFSGSATSGFQFSSSKLDVNGARSFKSFSTSGDSFLGVGFHLYLWGRK